MTARMNTPSQRDVSESTKATLSKPENDSQTKSASSSAQHDLNSTAPCIGGSTMDSMTWEQWGHLPKPTIPPREEFQPIEKFVSDAINSRHVNSLPATPSEEGEAMSSPSSNSTPAAAGYRAILDLLRKQDDLPMLRKVYLALRTNGIEKMSSERSKHNRMIHYIFRMTPFDFRQRESEVMQNHSLGIAYLNFIVALTSANSVFLTPTLNSLWKRIRWTDAVTPDERTRYIPTKEQLSEADEQALLKYQLQANSLLHGALRKVIQLVPKGSTEIYPVIASSFPFKLTPSNEQVNYIKQCMIVLKYVPTMQRKFLELCVDKCLEIDVEIRIAKNGSVKIEERGNGAFDKNSDGELDNDGTNHQLDEEDIKEQNKLKEECLEKLKAQTDEEKVDEMADKLDTLMYLIFEHIGTMAKSKKKTARQLFNMLMPTFDSVILTTHRCKFVQFIIIFLCGLDKGEESSEHLEEKTDNGVQIYLFREFAAKLIDVVLDPVRATVTRQSAACYLASFASRAACVCPETACEAVSALLRFAEAYMDAFPTESSARNVRRYLGSESNGEQAGAVSAHSLFYTVCQASFYIMCFRGKECIEYHQKAVEYHSKNDKDDGNNDTELSKYSDPQLVDITIKRWNRLCSHHLNPLKFCLESVRGEFLILASHFNLLDKNLLETMIIQDRKLASGMLASNTTDRPKKRRRVTTSIQTAATLERRRVAGGVGGLGKGSNPLDSFFPFDPYLLRRSYDFVEPHYRHWNGGCTVSDDIDESEEKEENESTVNHDDYYDISSDVDDESISQDSSFLSDDEDAEDADKNEKITEEGKGLTAISLTSTSVSMGGSEWTDDLTDHENCFDREIKDTGDWVNELKRARAMSIDDCW